MAGKKASITGAMLEQCIHQLPLVGFVGFESAQHFRKTDSLPPRYYVRNWPHLSLYGTPGRKEAYLVAADCKSKRLLADESGQVRCILEAKFQDGSGSVDEKFPHLVEACLASDVRNWLIVCGGRWWKKGRGAAAVAWLEKRALLVRQYNRRLVVIHQVKGFSQFIATAWGNQ